MASCTAVITSALKKIAVNPPTSDELADGLTALQSMYDALVNGGAFGRLHDVVITSNYTAQEGDRVFVNTDNAVTVTIPDTYDRTANDAPARCKDPTPGTRTAKDLGVIVINTIDTAEREVWVRDNYLGAWVNVLSLTLADDAPLAGRNLDGLCCYLATLVADTYSDRDVNPRTALGAARFLSQLTHRPGSESQPVEVGFF